MGIIVIINELVLVKWLTTVPGTWYIQVQSPLWSLVCWRQDISKYYSFVSTVFPVISAPWVPPPQPSPLFSIQGLTHSNSVIFPCNPSSSLTAPLVTHPLLPLIYTNGHNPMSKGPTGAQEGSSDESRELGSKLNSMRLFALDFYILVLLTTFISYFVLGWPKASGRSQIKCS